MEEEFVRSDAGMDPANAEVHKTFAVLRFVNEASANIHTFLSPEKIDVLFNDLKTTVEEQTRNLGDKDKADIQKTLAMAEAKLKGFDVNALNNISVAGKTSGESNEIKKTIRETIMSLSTENIPTSEYNDRLKVAIIEKLGVPQEQRAVYEVFIDAAVVEKKLLTKVKENEIPILEKVTELTFQSFIDISKSSGAEKNQTLEDWKLSTMNWDSRNVDSLDRERSIESTRIVENCIKHIESINPKLQNVESYKKDEIICTLSQEVYRNKELSTEFLKNPELDKEAHDKLQQIIERSLDKQFKKQELINCFNEKQPKRPSLDDASREIITKKLEATIDMCHDKTQGFSKEKLDKFYENATKAALTSIDKKTTYSLNRTGIKISPTVSHNILGR